MTLYTEPNLTGGFDDLLISTADSVPAFTPSILLFVFGLVFLGGAIAQKKRIGSADMPFWAILASTSTTMIALIMTLGDGMINLITLGIVVAINIMCAVWFFLSKVRGEQ